MLKIGFDAKRLFHNTTGLGNYSRGLVRGLKEFHPENNYILFSPSISYNEESYYFTKNFELVTPSFFSGRALWRTNLIINSLIENEIDIYHGLSHELPLGLEKTGIKSVVTIHDLIYKLFPYDFPLIDKKIYDLKWYNACTNADAIIATSEATKRDIISYFNIDPNKIHVVYQTCSDIYDQKYSEETKRETIEKNGLPKQYMLYVGAIMERKNLLNIIKAYERVRDEITIPLLVVGKGRNYQKLIVEYIEQNNLQDRIIIRSDIGNDILPIVYQCAEMYLYPSQYEGFGIPILEAFKSGTPAIISNTSSLPEVGGNAGCYVDPYKIESISQAMLDIHENPNLRNHMINEGYEQAKKFTIESFAQQTTNVYTSLI